MSPFWRQILQPWLLKIKAFFQWQDHPAKPGSDLLVNLEEARREWLYAQNYFNCVSDRDLIDHAIFYMGATEKKYVYLLKKVRENGLCEDNIAFNHKLEKSF